MTTDEDYSDLDGRFNKSFERRVQELHDRGQPQPAIIGAVSSYTDGDLTDLIAAVNRAIMAAD